MTFKSPKGAGLAHGVSVSPTPPNLLLRLYLWPVRPTKRVTPQEEPASSCWRSSERMVDGAKAGRYAKRSKVVMLDFVPNM